MSPTTVGYGDVAGATSLMRLATVTEAAAGFGLMTAAITHVLSTNPHTTDLRGAARMVETQADDSARAARLVVLGGPSDLQDLQHELLTIDENTERFPFLYYFRAKDAAASLPTLMRGATVLCLAARWGVSPDAAPYARTETSCSCGRSSWCAQLGMTAPIRARTVRSAAVSRFSCGGARRSLTTWPSTTCSLARRSSSLTEGGPARSA